MKLRPVLFALLALSACGPCGGAETEAPAPETVDEAPTPADEAPTAADGDEAPEAAAETEPASGAADAGAADSGPPEGSGVGALFPGCEPYVGMGPTDCVSLPANLCVKMVCRGCATMANNIDACERGESDCEPEAADHARRCGASYVQCLLDAGCDGDHREDGARQAACSSTFQMCAAGVEAPAAAPLGE